MSQRSTFFNIQEVLDEASQEVQSTVPDGKTLSLNSHSGTWWHGLNPTTAPTQGSMNIYVRTDGGPDLGEDNLPVPSFDGATETAHDAKTALKDFAKKFANPDVAITDYLKSTCGRWTAKLAQTRSASADPRQQDVTAVVLMYNVAAEPAPIMNGIH